MPNDNPGKVRLIPASVDDAQYEELLKQMPPGSVGIEGSVVNDLGLAIGCYIATGDAVGQLMAMDLGDQYMIFISYNPNDPVDSADFARFSTRLAEMDGIKFIKSEGPDPLPQLIYELHVPKNRVSSLARELVRSPGKSSWRSEYEQIRQVFGKQLDRIALD